MLASFWWIKWPQLAGFQGRTWGEKALELPGMLHSQWLFLCVSAAWLVSLWASGLLADPLSFFSQGSLSCNTAAPFFCSKKIQQKSWDAHFHTAVGNLELEHYMGNSGFFGFCVKLCRRFWSMPVVVGTGKPLASHRALWPGHPWLMLLLRIGCNLKVGHFLTLKSTHLRWSIPDFRDTFGNCGNDFFLAKVLGSGISGEKNHPGVKIPGKFLLCLGCWPGFLMQSWMLSVIQSRRPPTFCTLVWGIRNGLAGWCWGYISSWFGWWPWPWLLGLGEYPGSPKFVPPKKPPSPCEVAVA